MTTGPVPVPKNRIEFLIFIPDEISGAQLIKLSLKYQLDLKE
jgi:hypothetical protein